MGGTEGIEVVDAESGRDEEILSDEALAFVAALQREFRQQRRRLLSARADRQRSLDSGEWPDFNPATRSTRAADWQVGDVPKDLLDRRVEITGPAERKMMINALNSGARVFMCDFEDALSPTWHNVVEGQRNLRDAIVRTRIQRPSRQAMVVRMTNGLIRMLNSQRAVAETIHRLASGLHTRTSTR